jgi:hypothetical protein
MDIKPQTTAASTVGTDLSKKVIEEASRTRAEWEKDTETIDDVLAHATICRVEESEDLLEKIAPSSEDVMRG